MNTTMLKVEITSNLTKSPMKISQIVAATVIDVAVPQMVDDLDVMVDGVDVVLVAEAMEVGAVMVEVSGAADLVVEDGEVPVQVVVQSVIQDLPVLMLAEAMYQVEHVASKFWDFCHVSAFKLFN